MKKSLLTLLTLLTLTASAQRVTDKLDRGLVAIPGQNSGTFVSWRIFAEEYYDVTYNLYRNGTLIKSGLKVSNFNDTSGAASNQYQVAAVVRGVEQEKCAAVKRWSNTYFDIPVQSATDRNGVDATADYQLNDVSLADLDGDGVTEFIVKRPCNVAHDVSQKVRFHHVDCYNLQGERLWWIDMGPNMLAGADEQWDVVAYDWDMDGKAEVLLRGQDNMIIHHSDGTTTEIGDMKVDTRWNGIEYTSSGNEYLLYLEGQTAKPYPIGTGSTPNYMTYPLTRGQDSDWGTGIVGHRSTKHYFGAPFLDGRKASIFLGRGAYTMHKMAAYDVDPATHRLTQRWYWECTVGGPWFGQGYHNYGIADVDEDGRDEIVFGSMIIDDNGKGLSTTGFGHGDAQHCSDFDPYRKGLEFFACNEEQPNMNYRNATTSELYYRSVGTADDGRGLMANFSNTYPGSLGRSVNTGMISSVADREVPEAPGIDWSDLSFRFYWDGDLCSEVLDSPGANAREFKVEKPGTGRLTIGGANTAPGSATCNSSKNNPCATGDIFGDWREELVARTGDNKNLRIYVSNYVSNYGITTLWHDHQYRNAMVWQCMGYNQPPHLSYFLGEMEGLTVAPPPLTMTGRTEVPNGGTITGEDKHFIVCETGNTTINIQDGANPYIVTFNVPSWVQGTAGNNSTDWRPAINYDYYTCTVTGGALTGQTRLVKQGDGILALPKVDMTHTGETNIWAGTLRFDGTLRQSPLWLNRFAVLESNGGVFQSIKADYASVIRPGAEGITVEGELKLGFGSIVELTLDGAAKTATLINAKTLATEKKTTAAWVNYGPKYLQPVLRVVSDNLAEGEYLIGHVEKVSNLSHLKVEGTGDMRVNLRHDEDGSLFLILSTTRLAGDVKWTGANSNVWDFANTENFALIGDETATSEVFVGGDNVTFDDTAAKQSISLASDINAGNITFANESKAYTLSGTGSITEGTLYKTGAGKLTISTDNTYTGGNHITGGTVIVKSLSNDVLAYGNLGAVTNAASKFTIENGATLQTTAAVTNGSPIQLVGEAGGIINNAADFVQQKAFSGTLLTKQGNGWLKTSVAGSSLNRMAIAAGTVQNGAGNVAKVVEFQGGALLDNIGTSHELNIPEKKSGTWTTSNRQTYTNKVTGAGKLVAYGAAEKGSGWVATRTPLRLNLSAFEGTLEPHAVIADDGRFTLDTSNGSNKWTLDIPSGVTVLNSGKTLQMGCLTGSGTLGGYASFANDGSTGTNTWKVGGDKDFTFSGTIVEGNFEKTGTGKMTHKGTGSFSGSCKVSGGELCLNNSSSTSVLLGTGALTVSKGATLSGRGLLANSSVTIAKEGTLRSGLTETNAQGKLQFSDKNVTVNGTVQTYVNSSTSYSKFQGIKTLKLNGTLAVRCKEGLALEVGTELKIFEATTVTVNDALQLDLDSPNAALGLTWDTSRLSEGILVVAPAPDSITQVPDSQSSSNQLTHTLSGQRVAGQPQRAGIYIVNGKKKLIK